MTAAKVSQPPIVRVRFSASGLPRSSFLVHAPGAATMSSPVSKRTICIKRIIICSLLLYHLFALLSAHLKFRRNFGKSPKKLRFSGLAGAFTWNISVRRMLACASVFAPCSLLPSRTLSPLLCAAFCASEVPQELLI